MQGLHIFIAVIFLSMRLSWTEEICNKITSCSCETFRGVIDLSPLAMLTGNPRFLDIKGLSGEFQYSWNPCANFSEGLEFSKHCLGVAACQHEVKVPSNYYDLGHQDSAIFYYNENEQLILKYLAAADKLSERQTLIQLSCDPSADGRLDVVGEVAPFSGVYYMTLYSKYACPTGGTTQVPTTTMDPNLYPKIEILLLASILCAVLFVLAVVALSTRAAKSRYHAKDVLASMDDEKLLDI